MDITKPKKTIIIKKKVSSNTETTKAKGDIYEKEIEGIGRHY